MNSATYENCLAPSPALYLVGADSAELRSRYGLLVFNH
jgi:hypothetical protein